MGTGFSELLSGSVLLGGVVLSDEADEEAGPESKNDAGVGLPGSELVDFASEGKLHLSREDVDAGDDHSGHEDSGDPELNLENCLNSASQLLEVDVSEELADEGGDDAHGGHNEWEVDGVGGLDDLRAS